MPPTLYLLDGHAMLYRAYYAFIKRPITNSKGFDTSVLYGFTRQLIDLIRKERPSHLIAAFDPGGKNFRHERYPLYKANRPKAPEVIINSLPVVKAFLEAFRIPVVVAPGYEADDVIGTIAKEAERKGYNVLMVTHDKDYGQLVSEHIAIGKPTTTGAELEKIGVEAITQKYHIERPEQVIDVLSLWGDSSDNVPGVEGIGEVRAKRLIAEYGSVENLLLHTGRLPEKQRTALEAARAQLPLTKYLITIDTHVPVEWSEAEAQVGMPDVEALQRLFAEYEFHSLRRPLAELCNELAAPPASSESAAAARPTHQLSLFGEPAAPPAEGVQGAALEEETMEKNIPAAAPGEPPLPLDTIPRTVRTVPHRYRTAQNEAEVAQLLSELHAAAAFCFGTATTGLDPMQSELAGLSFSVTAHEAWYAPAPAGREATTVWLQRFRPLFADGAKAKTGQNVKHDLLMLKQYGIEVNGFLYDTLLMHYLLDPEGRHSTSALSLQYLHYQPVEIEELIGRKGARQGAMAQVPLGQMAEYAAEDADITGQLKPVLEQQLVENNLMELYRSIEAPLIRVLAEMEFEGVNIDVAALNEYGKELHAQLARLDEEIKTLAGNPSLNISSPKQLGIVLFEKLQLNSRKKTRTRQYSTDEETLQSLAGSHPIVAKILAFRSLRKLLSGYIEALPALVNGRTGKIHTTFNQFVTATGRLSSNNPNLQNIPIRDENGREIRKAFIASDPQHVLMAVDYSQIELRLMAHLSEDPAMLEAFLRNEDIHTATAARIFHEPIERITREQRRQAKTANFGIIYGISSFGLAQRLQIARGEAKKLIDGYFATYPGVQRYMEQAVERAREKGYVSTLFGRRRTLRDLYSANAGLRSYAERNAINTPIQGAAADIIKVAMIRVHGEMTRLGLRSRMILQVHDELVFDVWRPELDELNALVRREMEQAVALKVPLPVETGAGNNWLEAH